MFITEIQYSVGQVLPLRIKLPEEDGMPPYLDVTVETRWIKRDANPELYRVGCHFEDMNETKSRLVDHVAELLAF